MAFLVTKQFWLESLLADRGTHAERWHSLLKGLSLSAAREKKGLPNKPVELLPTFVFSLVRISCYLQGTLYVSILLDDLEDTNYDCSWRSCSYLRFLCVCVCLVFCGSFDCFIRARSINWKAILQSNVILLHYLLNLSESILC